MKSYLNLISISAKVHRRQNRMTILCIVISVMLVTAMFSIAELTVRTEREILLKKHGNWHYKIKDVSDDAAEKLWENAEIIDLGWAETFNEDADQPYYIGDKKAVIAGCDKVYMTEIMDINIEGRYPENDKEVLLSSNAKNLLNVQTGDIVTLHTPSMDMDYTVSGFGAEGDDFYNGQTYMIVVSMRQEAFAEIMRENGVKASPDCYIRFASANKAVKNIKRIKEEFELKEDSISENIAILGGSGKSGNKTMTGLYKIAGVLFSLVLVAGILMISGSMNSNVVQRTKFFGMMSCIGASRRQIIKLVRLEALNWCKIAIPVGLILGTLAEWIVCILLRFSIGGEFSSMPLFFVGPAGIVSGVVVGVATVLLAAGFPAKRAAKVSPIAALTGSSEKKDTIRHAKNIGTKRIACALGIRHAVGTKRSLILMTASFAVSIILYMSFSVGFEFCRQLLGTFRPWQPDLSIGGYSNELIIDRELKNEIARLPGVEQAFSNSYISGVPVDCSRAEIETIDIVSYDGFILERSKDHIIQGDILPVFGDSDYVCTIRNKDNLLDIGDTITINGEKVEISCILSDGLFASDLIVICSQETFDRLIGMTDYSMINIRLSKDHEEAVVQRIYEIVPDGCILTDLREDNRNDRNTYLAVCCLGYGFLAVIAMITLFNIINSISMSVTARTKEYGLMRAVGMDGDQLTVMIAAETAAYALSGVAAGCGLGLLIHRFLYRSLLTRYFGYRWEMPYMMIVVIVLFFLVTVICATYAPSKRICNMSVTETIRLT